MEDDNGLVGIAFFVAGIILGAMLLCLPFILS